MKARGKMVIKYASAEQRRKAAASLKNILPFEVWKARRNPGPEEIETYWSIVKEWEKIASGKCVVSVTVTYPSANRPRLTKATAARQESSQDFPRNSTVNGGQAGGAAPSKT
ncbi:MAG: hypothetical protein PHU21_07450 [Elusimicrobia bacterium]|nr:hypothetical protein [Elusimicrobiota bacterium]